MKLYLIALLLATFTYVNTEFVELQPADYAFDDQVRDSLDWGYKWIVEDATNRDLIPRGDFYVAELNSVQKQERNNGDGADFRFNTLIRSRQRTRVEGSFTVFYKYRNDVTDATDNDPTDPTDNEDWDDWNDLTDDGNNEFVCEVVPGDEWWGPERVVSYNYDYSYQIVDGETIETEVNTFFPVEFVVTEVVNEEGELDISVDILQPEWPEENEEAFEGEIEVIEENNTEVEDDVDVDIEV